MKTDEEIIKGLELCSTYECSGCPYINSDRLCTDELIKDAFELTKRQRTENERLKKELEQSEQSGDILETILEEKNADISELIFKERDNAVREFADMLKQYADNYGSGDEFIAASVIDDVMKDMTERTDNDG